VGEQSKFVYKFFEFSNRFKCNRLEVNNKKAYAKKNKKHVLIWNCCWV